ncbi:MAG: hypothetical protein IPG79_18225 [Saprospiraceae bacterium]|nr:hypothetical protein [Saprospiraceae bacterium]
MRQQPILYLEEVMHNSKHNIRIIFGSAWNSTLNPTPSTIPVFGSILDVLDMSMYVALVVVGGTGAQAYNVDGIYSSQGVGGRFLSATTVQNVAEKLNSLAIEAIISGKPVMGQCHGAGIPANWRYPIPNMTPRTQLGPSILSGNQATGFPEPATADSLSNLGITYFPNSPVVIASPHTSVPDNNAGNHKIISTRDWYPQTVAHAALTLLNILRTFPPTTSSSIDVLILHGGAVDQTTVITLTEIMTFHAIMEMERMTCQQIIRTYNPYYWLIVLTMTLTLMSHM